MTLARYPDYKDSEAPWLGGYPSHWRIVPLWALFRRTKRSGYVDEELLSVYRDYGVIPKASRDDNNNKPSDDLGAYQLVDVGDLVINKMKAWQGSVAVSSVRGIVSPAYFTYAALHQENSRYLHYLMRSARYITGYLSLSKGIRVSQWDLDPEYHSRMPILIPPRDEQDRIARVLDSETAKIDALVEEQQRLIDLLKEKRQAVISQAVTKGLDSNVPMKDSGVEWLGKVPAHWDLTMVKHCCSTTSGGTPNTAMQDAYYTDETGIPWVRTMDLTNDVLCSVEVHITERAIQDTACRVLPPGTVMVAMYGGDGTVGKNGLLGIPAAINQAICGLLPSNSVIPEFLFRYMQFFRPYWMVGAESSRKDPNISQERVRNAPVLLPPKPEQAAIVEFLNEQSDGIDELRAEALVAVELLQERRAALISAAVTGKIDVREAE